MRELGALWRNDDNVTRPAAMIDDDDQSSRGIFKWHGLQDVSKVR